MGCMIQPLSHCLRGLLSSVALPGGWGPCSIHGSHQRLTTVAFFKWKGTPLPASTSFPCIFPAMPALGLGVLTAQVPQYAEHGMSKAPRKALTNMGLNYYNCYCSLQLPHLQLWPPPPWSRNAPEGVEGECEAAHLCQAQKPGAPHSRASHPGRPL